MTWELWLRSGLLGLATVLALVPRQLFNHASSAADTPTGVVIAGALPLVALVCALTYAALPADMERRRRGASASIFAAVLVLPVAERLGLGGAGVIVTCCLAWALAVAATTRKPRVPVDMPVAKPPDNDVGNTR